METKSNALLSKTTSKKNTKIEEATKKILVIILKKNF